MLTNNIYTIGTDPEFMISYKGEIKSSIPFMRGDKNNKEDLGNGMFAYSDNVNIELNVPPTKSPDEFVGVLGDLFSNLRNKHPEFSVTTTASHNFSKKECEQQGAAEFGCNPEYCAYLIDMVQPPEGGKTFRSAGGHIHLGNKTFNQDEKNGYLLDMDDKIQAIRLMDIYVGIPLVLMDNDPTSLARKELYGKAGRFRPTEYGVEYRTPSPYWLTNPRLASITAQLTFLVMEIGDNKQGDEVLNSFNMDDVKNAIDNHDKKLAKEIFDRIVLSDGLRTEILEFAATKLDQDVYKNW